MKANISKIFSWIKALFLRLRVIVTLQLGRDKVEPRDDTTQGGNSDD